MEHYITRDRILEQNKRRNQLLEGNPKWMKHGELLTRSNPWQRGSIKGIFINQWNMRDSCKREQLTDLIVPRFSINFIANSNSTCIDLILTRNLARDHRSCYRYRRWASTRFFHEHDFFSIRSRTFRDLHRSRGRLTGSFFCAWVNWTCLMNASASGAAVVKRNHLFSVMFMRCMTSWDLIALQNSTGNLLYPEDLTSVHRAYAGIWKMQKDSTGE